MRVSLIGASVLAWGVLGFLACASDEGGETAGSGSTGGTSNGGTSGDSGNPGGSGGSGGIAVCASGLICGAGVCCASGEECVLGACLAACTSQVRCGEKLDVCCAASEVCLSNQCVVPGTPCLEWADCEVGEFCEPTLGKCLPQPSGGTQCEYKPPAGPLTPAVEWSWQTSSIHPTFLQVITMPIVVDLEQDGTPDVVIVTSEDYGTTDPAYLRALDGATGQEKWAASAGVYQSANRIHARGTPAAGDIDGDGMVEIVAQKMGGGLIAFEHDGSLKWVATQANGTTPWTVNPQAGAVTIADLEGNGTPEIVLGGIVFEATGQMRFDNGVAAGSNNGTYGAISIVADVNGDGTQEIVTGRRAWTATGSLLWDNTLVDGYPAIADFELDGVPELVVIAQPNVRVHNAVTGALLAQLAMPAAGAGGPPTIADFDADGTPEIASANGGAYAVFEYTALPTPVLSVKWTVVTQDLSSNRTGSSVFDFQGDGAAEVVYNDECYLRVYNGSDGSVLYQVENPSATIHEYPVVVDVDGDNNTEIVIVANDENHIGGPTSCPYGTSGLRHGVFVYGDANDQWVRTRRIWNQHAYHITNVGVAGDIPAPESASWIVPPGFNNYRQSNQGEGVFNAPDLKVSLEALLTSCPGEVTLRATVSNQGSLGVAPGIPVSFFVGTPPSGTFLATLATTKALLPGQFEVVTFDYSVTGTGAMSFYAIVDGNQQSEGVENECLEDNNEASVTNVKCPSIR